MEECLNFCSHQIKCKLEVFLIFCFILKAAVLKVLDAALHFCFYKGSFQLRKERTMTFVP